MIDVGSVKNVGSQVEKIGLIATWNLRTAHAEAQSAAILLKCCTRVKVQFMVHADSDSHYELMIKEVLGSGIRVEFEKL